MTKYTAFSDDAEVAGRVILSFVKCVTRSEIQPMLEQHDLMDVQPNEWYLQQRWLNVLTDISEEHTGNAMLNLIDIGIHITESAKFPPDFVALPLPKVLMNWGNGYKLNNRGSDVGQFSPQIIDKKHVKMIFSIPYPDDMLYGVFYAVARRWLPEATGFTVKYNESSGPRRDNGGTETVIDVVWD